MALIELCERGFVPDFLTRQGIRQLCAQRLRDAHVHDMECADASFRHLLSELRGSPIAIEVAAANQQHYEVPTRFFELCLGRRLKYSSAYYPDGDESLDAAEEKMLALYIERAGLKDRQRILELGCGWGSLTLWMAERFPNSRITGVSNSRTQRDHILSQAARLGLGNIEIITTDVNRLELDAGSFDRCLSIEMFEHMRNYGTLLDNIARWLKPGGALFVHIFCHRSLMYPFETAGESNWMGRHFFTGGLMPSADTLLHFQSALRLDQRWLLSGRHYQKTANHWLDNQDRHRAEVLQVLTEAYGSKDAAIWAQRWRMFWMACAELFGYASGSQWGVAHYRFAKRQDFSSLS